MPRLDGTGSIEEGAMAGRGIGKCRCSGLQSRLGVGCGRRNKNQNGMINGRGMGMGRGFGFRYGQNKAILSNEE